MTAQTEFRTPQRGSYVEVPLLQWLLLEPPAERIPAGAASVSTRLGPWNRLIVDWVPPHAEVAQVEANAELETGRLRGSAAAAAVLVLRLDSLLGIPR